MYFWQGIGSSLWGIFFMEKNHVHLNFLFKMLHIFHLIKTKAINMTYQQFLLTCLKQNATQTFGNYYSFRTRGRLSRQHSRQHKSSYWPCDSVQSDRLQPRGRLQQRHRCLHRPRVWRLHVYCSHLYTGQQIFQLRIC